MYHHFIAYSTFLYHASVRSQVSGKNGQASCLAVRIVNRADNFRILVYTSLDIFSYGLSCNCHTVQIQKILFRQLVHYCVDTSGLVQILNVSRTCRCQMAEIRCFLTDLICECNVKIPADLMGNSRQMKHTVG